MDIFPKWGVKMKKGLKSPPNDTVDHFPFTSLGSSNYQPEDHCQTPHFNNASTTLDTLGSADPRINQFRRPRAYGNLYNSLVAREGILTSYTQEKISEKHGVGSGLPVEVQWWVRKNKTSQAIPTLYLDLYPWIHFFCKKNGAWLQDIWWYWTCMSLSIMVTLQECQVKGNNTPFRIVASRKQFFRNGCFQK